MKPLPQKHHQSFISTISWVLVILFLSGCASVYKPANLAAVESDADSKQGYRKTFAQRKPVGDVNVILAFSGGGTRASALSYGVMKELRETYIGEEQSILLDEVDMISSVSGGSFTAAYYGVFGDKLFSDFETDFLRQSVQSSLLRKLFNPGYWLKSLFTGFDRTEMAVDYYDNTIFKGATFSDIDLSTKPFIEVNATDLNGGRRFSFIQGNFDLICSDLNQFDVARAVTASSAVPILFPSVVLRNHADQCDISSLVAGQALALSNDYSDRYGQLIEDTRIYRDVSKKPYIHLVDGGISDNLGLRSIIEHVTVMSALDSQKFKENFPRKTLIILVNATVERETTIDSSANKPSISQTLQAISDTGIARYSFETIQLLNELIVKVEEKVLVNGSKPEIHLVQVDFQSIESPSIGRYFNNLPTSLELDSDEVDVIVEAGRLLLRNSSEFKAFLTANNGRSMPKQEYDACKDKIDLRCIPDRLRKIFTNEKQ